VADGRGEADRWWAGLLRVPETAMRAGGVFAASHLDHAGVVAVDGAAAPVVYGPADVIPLLRAATARADREALLQGDHLAGALGARAGQLRGPAWYGYATADTLAPAGSPAVREFSEADLPLLARLHEQVTVAERDESGTTGLPAYGYVDDGALLAVACLGEWQQMPTIGVLTHPRARGRGLAGLVVAEAAREGLRRRAVVQYRAWHQNTASISVALRTGFRHYGDALVIRLAQ
jgi:GNAT superfamily N-acetyltransferase